MPVDPQPDPSSLDKTFGSKTEERLASLWRSILPVKSMERRTDFFKSGGRSLSVVQLRARIRDTFGVELSIRQVFSNPSLQSMAAAIDSLDTRADVPPVSAREDGTEDSSVLSSSESFLWTLALHMPRYRSFNMQIGARLKGELHLDILERSVNEIVRRHEILRTNYPSRDGQPYRVIAPVLQIPIEIMDLRDFDDHEVQMLADAASMANAPFDLACGPLLRVRLYRLAEREEVLNFVVHHIVADAWSFGVFAHELDLIYRSFLQGDPHTLPEIPVPYARYATWQQANLAKENFQQALHYWRDHLGGRAPAARLKPDLIPETGTEARQETISCKVEATAAQVLRCFSEDHETTLFTTLLAALMLTLSRMAEQPQVAFAIPVSARSQSDWEPAIGLFASTIVLAATTEGDPSFAEFLKQVSEICNEGYMRHMVPFFVARQRFPEIADFSRIILDYIDPDYQLELPALHSTPFAVKADHPFDMDMTVFVRDRQGGLAFSIVYDRSRFSRPLMDQFLGNFLRVLEQIQHSASLQVSQFQVL